MYKKFKKGLTLMEIATVLVVMAIVVSILIPAITQVTKMAADTKQKSQFTAIGVSLELYRNEQEFGDYPESHNKRTGNNPVLGTNGTGDYCGAQKLAEAMVGYDLFGVHPDTEYKSDGTWIKDGVSYYYEADTAPAQAANYNGDKRKGPYIEVEKSNVIQLGTDSSLTPNKEGLYSRKYTTQINGLEPASYVLADSYKRTYNIDVDGDGIDDTRKIGMPILYFKARSNKYKLDGSNEDNSIYDFRDNKALVSVGGGDNSISIPWDITTLEKHELTSAKFYDTDGDPTTNYITNTDRTQGADKFPKNKDSYILISAGRDGLYGTEDDMFNFEK